jgi:hypothetical protein
MPLAHPRCVIAIFLAVASFAPQARAESECERNYRTAPSANGATIHGVSVGMYGADINTVTAALKQKGLGEGWTLVTEMNMQDMTGEPFHNMIFGQKPTEKSRGIFPIVQLAKKTDSAIIAVELPDKMSAPTIREYFCSFLASAGLKGQPSAASATNADLNFAYATELIAMHNGDDKPLEQHFQREYRAALDRVGKARQQTQDNAATAAQAAAANDRGAPPPDTDRRKVVKPDAVFNVNDVDPAQLLEGNSTISGMTCNRAPVTNQFMPAANQTIWLFAYTPYLKQAIDLIDKNRNKDADKVRLDIDPRAFVTRLEGRTNNEGKFRFSRIKPGRYLVMTESTITSSGTAYRPVGSSYDGASNTVTNFWQEQAWEKTSNDMLQADVTVKNDGDVVDNVVVKPMGRLMPVLSGVCKIWLK